MTKRQRHKTVEGEFCKRCHRRRLDDELFWRRLCKDCREQAARECRAATGERLLAKAKETGTEVRDGVAFKIVSLPPKRAHSKRNVR